MAGTMQIMDRTGDTKIIWDPDNRDEVDSARRTFDELKAKGYIAYEVKGDGDKGKVVTKFNKRAEKLILAPPTIGG